MLIPKTHLKFTLLEPEPTMTIVLLSLQLLGLLISQTFHKVQRNNFHMPVRITWTVFDTTSVPWTWTWWPMLNVSLPPLVGQCGGPYSNPWNYEVSAEMYWSRGFFICPGHKKNYRTCGRVADLFCYSSNCVSSNDGNRDEKVLSKIS